MPSGKNSCATTAEPVNEMLNRENVEGGELFRLLVEGVHEYAIFMLDPEGNILTWNLGAERIKGYRADEIIGKHFAIFYSAEDVNSGKPQHELAVATAVGRCEDTGWRVRKDGSRFWANVVITALRDPGGELRGFAKVTRDLTESKRAEDERAQYEQALRDSEASLRELSAQLIRLQDEERRRIGRNLHDSVGQNLAMLKLHLESLSFRPKAEELLRQKLTTCIHLVTDTLNEVRSTSYTLCPPMLEEVGLRMAIPWYLEGISKGTGIRINFNPGPEFARLPRDVERAFFRVIQESITNILRHSGSPVADVRVEIENGIAKLEISDHGKGIPADVLEAYNRGSLVMKMGVGLRGMKERVRQLGGNVEVFSTANGTTVRASVPYEEAVGEDNNISNRED